MRGDGCHFFNRLIKHAVDRVAFTFEYVEAENNILGGDGFAVMPACFGVQEKIGIAAIRGNGDGLGNQRIVGLRLIVRRGHERLKHKTRHTRGGDAFQDIGIERVKITSVAEFERAAFGSRRIHIVKMRKSGRIFRRAIHGEIRHWLCGQSSKCRKKQQAACRDIS